MTTAMMQRPLDLAPPSVAMLPLSPWVGRLGKLGLVIAAAALIAWAAYMLLPLLESATSWGYAAGFAIQAITSASLFLPVPGAAALAVMSQELNPLALAAAGAAGGALGELSGYWLGRQGGSRFESSPAYRRVSGPMLRHGGLVVFAFALLPVLPMDAAGIIAGIVRYPVARYLIAMFAGKALLLLAMFSAFSGLTYLQP